MSTTATVDTNEGWTFADRSHTSDFSTTTPTDNEQTMAEPTNDWSLATQAMTTDGWNVPTAPSPPLSAIGRPRQDDHASLHWTACYDNYCSVHRQMKDNNYDPHKSRRPCRMQFCDCPLPHPDELLAVTRERRLHPVKAYTDWHRGKRVCPDCRFLMNPEDHHLRCSAAAPRAPLANITPPQEDQENKNRTDNPAVDPAATAAVAAALQDEQLTLLGEIITMIHQTTTRDARRNHVVHRTLAQRMNEFHDADQQQLQRMATTMEAIIAEQQRMNEQLRTRQQASRPVRIYRTPIRHHPVTPPPRNTPRDLAGASVWTGGILS